jgi:arylsulfatase A-like enzyme
MVVVLAMQVAWTDAMASAAPPRRPNIVILYADDLGYGDVNRYNPDRGRIPTPHIDRLADTGMRFTDGHSSSGVCSPSRYALLTGRYHWRTRLQAGIVGTWGNPLIAPDRLTIAGLAKQHGYRTAAIGKWHLGWDWPIKAAERPLLTVFGGAKRVHGNTAPQLEVTAAHRDAWHAIFSQPIGGGPTTRGFDRYFGTDVPNWPPYCFIENDRTAGEDSFSLLPLLSASSPEAAEPVRRHAVSCSMGGTPAIRDGRWKLILGYDPGFTKQGAENGSMEAVDFQLYDLAADLGQQKNVTDDHPARVAEMKAAYEKLVADGRSTPGVPQRNDVDIVRYTAR